jgi:hypothetical protein
MSDEAKKDVQGPEEAKSAELSAEDLGQVTGGAGSKVTLEDISFSKVVDKLGQ